MPITSAPGADAVAEFGKRLDQLGATLLEDRWLGYTAKHHVVCRNGHDCYVRPSDIRRGEGVCRKCAGKDPIHAEEKFRARVAELGGVCLYPSWRGVHKPHHVRCANGHDCYPRPSGITGNGTGICKACATNGSFNAEKDFRKSIAELGGVCLYVSWQGVMSPHHIRCKNGHDCYPNPNSVKNGQGICRICAVGADDIFYIVRNPDDGTVKFGITQKDPRPRMRDHRRDGYSEVIRIVGELPEGDPRDIERNIIHALRDAGIKPVKGREYYPSEAFALIMDVAEGFLSQYEITGEKVF